MDAVSSSLSVPSSVPLLPLARATPFDPPEELMRWQRESPVRRISYLDGHLGWLVTGHAEARAVLADRRFSVRPDLIHPPVSATAGSLTVPPGFFLRMDPPEHERYRRLLTGQFTVRRMRELGPRIDTIVEERLDAVQASGRPADLVSEFALPVPSLVICELLGVPYTDRARFQRDAATVLTDDASAEQRGDALADLMAYLTDLVTDKCRHRPDDLLGGLAAHDDLTVKELAGIALLLLVAGHETTANMLSLGAFAVLCDPTQRDALTRPHSEADVAAELLRHLSVIYIVLRSALEDVELAGRRIHQGETVTVSLAAANRDAARFPGGSELDLTRGATGHLAFGHGIHQCLGHQLARMEIRAALPALFRRFPALSLAVPSDEVPLRSNMAVYGVHRLPVQW